VTFIPLVDVPQRLASLLDHARPTPAAGGWFSFDSEADDDAATLTLYDEIGWYGTSDAVFAEALSGVTAKNLTVRLNSPGGSVFQGIAIANLLRSHSARVTVSVDGLAASIASVIAMAGDDIVMQPQSQMMVHKASGLCLGNDDDMEEMRDLLRRQSQNIARAYAARAGGRWDSWYNRMAEETWYSAEEAVAAGLADRVAQYPRKAAPAEPEPGAATAAKVWDLSIYWYAGRENAPAPTGLDGATGDDTARKTAPVAPAQAGASAGLGVADTACPAHSTGAEEGTWSKSDNEGRLPSPMPLATARKFYAAYDETRAEDGKIPKDAGSLPHHFVSADGTPGAASVSGVRAALGRLGQTHGLSDEDRAAAERHLRGHLPGDDEDRAGLPARQPPAPLAFGRRTPAQTRTLVFGRGGPQ
jgi:ATP-dependent protease ClpP protease subunit